MLLPAIVYSRTPRGKEEIAAPRFALHSGSRRLLFLVDGQRCTSELATMARGGELQFLLFELLVLELIEINGHLPIGDSRTFVGNISLTPAGEGHFLAVRGRLVIKLFDALGERASRIIEKLSASANPLELAEHLRPLKRALEHGRSPAEVERFLQKVARALIDSAPPRAADVATKRQSTAEQGQVE
jgi:hypothetical protein